MNFKKIDMNTWHRKDVFNHFMKDVRCFFTLTVEIDVTNLIAICKKQNLKFYPTVIYLVTKTVNQQDEFKLGYDDNGNIGIWDTVSPSYTVFHPEDEVFTKLISEYTVDFHEFYNNVIYEMDTNNTRRAFEIPYTQKNTFDISCLPWVSYKAFDLHIFDSGTYLAPVITWGKYEKLADAIMMPLTLQIHHAAADGFHASKFFLELQNRVNNFVFCN